MFHSGGHAGDKAPLPSGPQMPYAHGVGTGHLTVIGADLSMKQVARSPLLPCHVLNAMSSSLADATSKMHYSLRSAFHSSRPHLGEMCECDSPADAWGEGGEIRNSPVLPDTHTLAGCILSLPFFFPEDSSSRWLSRWFSLSEKSCSEEQKADNCAGFLRWGSPGLLLGCVSHPL